MAFLVSKMVFVCWMAYPYVSENKYGFVRGLLGYLFDNYKVKY
jgi:hypothetical protein